MLTILYEVATGTIDGASTGDLLPGPGQAVITADRMPLQDMDTWQWLERVVDGELMAIDNALVDARRSAAIVILNEWRDTMRRVAGLTEAVYLECRRWLNQPETEVCLTGVDAAKCVEMWEQADAAYNLAVSLVNQAKSVDEIKIILSRRGL